MNTLRQHTRALLTVTAVAAPLILGLISHEAAAGERAVQRTNATGKTISHNTVRKMDSGTYTANSTRTGANVQVSTRTSTGVLDKETGTWTRSATSTGPNGNSSTFNANVTRTDNGYVRDASRTGANGNTIATSTVGSYDPDTLTATRSTTVTGPQGQSSTSVTTRKFTPAP